MITSPYQEAGLVDQSPFAKADKSFCILKRDFPFPFIAADLPWFRSILDGKESLIVSYADTHSTTGQMTYIALDYTGRGICGS